MIKGKVKEEVTQNDTPNVLTTAVVYNGSREVRRYSVEEHGENFEKLAEEFASKRNYSVKLEEAKIGVKCPSCGHVFNPDRN